MSFSPSARLRAIVALDYRNRVRCQHPGCGRGIYARVHIVQEGDQFKVLGSDCYANHYGGAMALGKAQFGWGGGGAKLTDEQRALLIQNTQALIAWFEALEAQEVEERRRRLQEIAERDRKLMEAGHQQPLQRRGVVDGPGRLHVGRPSPWPWQKEGTSVAEFESPDGQCWFRVQHRDGSQKLVPWPRFQGWESALPVGRADQALGVVAVQDIVKAIEALKDNGFAGPNVGVLDELLRQRMRRRTRLN